MRCSRYSPRLAKLLSAGDGTYDVMISTNTPDRSGDRMNPQGCKFYNWQAAGAPVLWLHDWYGDTPSAGIPIGKANRIEITESGILANFEFDPKNEFAQQVKNAWDWGSLRASSIGFDIPDQKQMKQNDFGGYDIGEWELLEFSIVPIPMNPEALRVAKNMGIDEKLLAPEIVGPTWSGKPVEDTGEYIRVRVRDPQDFVEDSFRTIDISEEQGIKAVIGKLKSDPEGSTAIQTYLFAKEKGWTAEKAQAWVEERGKALGDRVFKLSPEEVADAAAYAKRIIPIIQEGTGFPSAEPKEGRVLSSKNRALIAECVKALQDLLDATEPSSEESEKSTRSAAAMILSGDRDPSPEREALGRLITQEKILLAARSLKRAEKVKP